MFSLLIRKSENLRSLVPNLSEHHLNRLFLEHQTDTYVLSGFNEREKSALERTNTKALFIRAIFIKQISSLKYFY